MEDKGFNDMEQETIDPCISRKQDNVRRVVNKLKLQIILTWPHEKLTNQNGFKYSGFDLVYAHKQSFNEFFPYVFKPKTKYVQESDNVFKLLAIWMSDPSSEKECIKQIQTELSNNASLLDELIREYHDWECKEGTTSTNNIVEAVKLDIEIENHLLKYTTIDNKFFEDTNIGLWEYIQRVTSVEEKQTKQEIEDQNNGLTDSGTLINREKTEDVYNYAKEESS